MHLPAKVEEVIERKQIQNENDTKVKYFGLYKWDILKAKVRIFFLSFIYMYFRGKNFMRS